MFEPYSAFAASSIEKNIKPSCRNFSVNSVWIVDNFFWLVTEISFLEPPTLTTSATAGVSMRNPKVVSKESLSAFAPVESRICTANPSEDLIDSSAYATVIEP